MQTYIIAMMLVATSETNETNDANDEEDENIEISSSIWRSIFCFSCRLLCVDCCILRLFLLRCAASVIFLTTNGGIVCLGCLPSGQSICERWGAPRKDYWKDELLLSYWMDNFNFCCKVLSDILGDGKLNNLHSWLRLRFWNLIFHNISYSVSFWNLLFIIKSEIHWELLKVCINAEWSFPAITV